MLRRDEATRMRARKRIESTGDEADEIERGFVGPVQIFDDDHRGMWWRDQLGEKRVERCRLVAGLEPRGRVAPSATRHVGERPERPRREEIVTAPDHDAGVRPLRKERVDERRFPGAGLPRDQHHLPGGADAIENVGECREPVGSLQKSHRRHDTKELGRPQCVRGSNRARRKDG